MRTRTVPALRLPLRRYGRGWHSDDSCGADTSAANAHFAPRWQPSVRGRLAQYAIALGSVERWFDIAPPWAIGGAALPQMRKSWCGRKGGGWGVGFTSQMTTSEQLIRREETSTVDQLSDRLGSRHSTVTGRPT
jgi:hypothetical protein